jgi:hypothetical protein
MDVTLRVVGGATVENRVVIRTPALADTREDVQVLVQVPLEMQGKLGGRWYSNTLHTTPHCRLSHPQWIPSGRSPLHETPASLRRLGSGLTNVLVSSSSEGVTKRT